MKKLLLGGVALALTLWAKSIADRRPRERAAPTGPIESSQLAQEYASLSRLPPFQLSTRWLASRALWGVEGDRAIDLGCGPGHLALEMARRRPDLEVVGIDSSDAMIAVASRNAGVSPAKRSVTFQRGSAELVPFPDHSFDLVVSTLSLHHFNDLPSVLSEVSRIIRPGGRFMLMDIRRDMGAVPWIGLWVATQALASPELRRRGEPLASRNAAYTPTEIAATAWRSPLPPWRVACGAFWLSLENIDSP